MRAVYLLFTLLCINVVESAIPLTSPIPTPAKTTGHHNDSVALRREGEFEASMEELGEVGFDIVECADVTQMQATMVEILHQLLHIREVMENASYTTVR